MKPTTTILKDASECFRQARGSLIEGSQLLHRIATQRLWEGQFDSFGAYVESECQISASYASKLVKTYEHYVIQGGLSHAKLKATDPEKLYLAIALKGSPERQAVKAETLSRQELKAETHEVDGKDCEHLTTIKICANCHARV